jgi:hypothetical protein
VFDLVIGDDGGFALNTFFFGRLALVSATEAIIYVKWRNLPDSDREKLLVHFRKHPEFENGEMPRFVYDEADEDAATMKVQAFISEYCRREGIDRDLIQQGPRRPD